MENCIKLETVLKYIENLKLDFPLLFFNYVCKLQDEIIFHEEVDLSTYENDVDKILKSLKVG